MQIEQIKSLGTLSSCKATGGSGGGASMADVDSELGVSMIWDLVRGSYYLLLLLFPRGVGRECR